MESKATCLRLIADWLVTNRQLAADGLQCQIQHEAILPSWHHFTTSVVMMISAVLETNWAWYIKCGKSKLRASRSQQNHYNHNRSVLICCKRNNFIYFVIMMATYTGTVLLFPNFLFFWKKCWSNSRQPVSYQSPTARWSLPTDRRLNAKRSPNMRRSVGDLSETDGRLVGCKTFTSKAPVPQGWRPRHDLSATDFDCDLWNHCNCFSITGIVGDYI